MGRLFLISTKNKVSKDFFDSLSNSLGVKMNPGNKRKIISAFFIVFIALVCFAQNRFVVVLSSIGAVATMMVAEWLNFKLEGISSSSRILKVCYWASSCCLLGLLIVFVVAVAVFDIDTVPRVFQLALVLTTAVRSFLYFKSENKSERS